MNLYDFLYALGFWQWIAVILLASILSATFTGLVVSIVKSFRKR